MKIEQIYEQQIKEKVVPKILEELPDWFTIEEAREQYITESAEQIFIFTGKDNANVESCFGS